MARRPTKRRDLGAEGGGPVRPKSVPPPALAVVVEVNALDESLATDEPGFHVGLDARDEGNAAWRGGPRRHQLEVVPRAVPEVAHDGAVRLDVEHLHVSWQPGHSGDVAPVRQGGGPGSDIVDSPADHFSIVRAQPIV